MSGWRVEKHRYAREFANNQQFVDAMAISSRMPRVGGGDKAAARVVVRRSIASSSTDRPPTMDPPPAVNPSVKHRPFGYGAGVREKTRGATGGLLSWPPNEDSGVHHRHGAIDGGPYPGIVAVTNSLSTNKVGFSPTVTRSNQSPPCSSRGAGRSRGGDPGGHRAEDLGVPGFLRHTASVSGKRVLGKVIPASPGPRLECPKYYPVLTDMTFKERLAAAEEAEVEAALAAQAAAMERAAAEAEAAKKKKKKKDKNGTTTKMRKGAPRSKEQPRASGGTPSVPSGRPSAGSDAGPGVEPRTSASTAAGSGEADPKETETDASAAAEDSARPARRPEPEPDAVQEGAAPIPPDPPGIEPRASAPTETVEAEEAAAGDEWSQAEASPPRETETADDAA